MGSLASPTMELYLKYQYVNPFPPPLDKPANLVRNYLSVFINDFNQIETLVSQMEQFGGMLIQQAQKDIQRMVEIVLYLKEKLPEIPGRIAELITQISTIPTTVIGPALAAATPLLLNAKAVARALIELVDQLHQMFFELLQLAVQWHVELPDSALAYGGTLDKIDDSLQPLKLLI